MQNQYQRIYAFPNGYGASVVCNEISYGNESGLFEIAVMRDSAIVYDTPVTSDVIAFCDFAKVAETLAQIESLNPATV